jgi:hypothetical protein
VGRTGTVGLGLLAGAIGACCFLAMQLGSPGAAIFAYLAQLPLFAAGLWLGGGASMLAGLGATALVLAFGGAVAAGLFAGLYAAPVAVLVRQSLLARRQADGTLEWYPPGFLAAWLTGLGLAAMAAVVVLLGGPDGIRALLREALAPALSSLTAERAAEGNAFVAFVARVMPGIVAVSWMVMTFSNGALAQGVLARFGAAWRPSPDLAGLTLPPWIPALVPVAVLAIALGGTARFLGVNLLIALGVPFCLAGLAVLHAFVRRLQRPAMLLATFYVLTGLLGWPLLLVAVVGIADSVLGLRRRWAPASTVRRSDDG